MKDTTKVTIGKLIRVCASYYPVGCEHCPFYKYNCNEYLNRINGKVETKLEVTLKK